MRSVSWLAVTQADRFSSQPAGLGADQIYLTGSGGGPETGTYVLGIMLFQQAFAFLDFGYASALAWVMFAILLVLTVLTAAFAWTQAIGADGQPAPGFGVYAWGGAYPQYTQQVRDRLDPKAFRPAEAAELLRQLWPECLLLEDKKVTRRPQAKIPFDYAHGFAGDFENFIL